MRARPRDPFHRIVIDDLRSASGLAGAVKRDFGDLYDFYLDDEERTRLDAMGRVQRTLYMGWLLFKALLLALSPARRLLILGALLLGLLLYRTNAQSRAMEEQLRYEGVPYILIGCMQFYERKEVKDALCCLKALANPADELALLRIINFPRRGIGEGSVLRIGQ